VADLDAILATLDRLYAMAAKDHPGAEAGFSAPPGASQAA
jgi:hypothetical protein